MIKDHGLKESLAPSLILGKQVFFFSGNGVKFPIIRVTSLLQDKNITHNLSMNLQHVLGNICPLIQLAKIFTYWIKHITAYLQKIVILLSCYL